MEKISIEVQPLKKREQFGKKRKLRNSVAGTNNMKKKNLVGKGEGGRAGKKICRSIENVNQGKSDTKEKEP